MDVDSDGSDPDRLNAADTTDPTFQPLTSYKWPRRTAVPSVLLKPYQDRLDKLEAEVKATPTLRRSLSSAIDAQKNDLYQIEHYSSLIARTDPYIVLPGVHGAPDGPSLPAAPGRLRRGARGQPALSRDLRRHRSERSARRGQPAVGASGRSPRDARAQPRQRPQKLPTSFFPARRTRPPDRPTWEKSGSVVRRLLNEIGGKQVRVVRMGEPDPAASHADPGPHASPHGYPLADTDGGGQPNAHQNALAPAVRFHRQARAGNAMSRHPASLAAARRPGARRVQCRAMSATSNVPSIHANASPAHPRDPAPNGR